MPHGPPPVNRRDRRPARVTQLERNARIAQLGRGGRHRRGGRPGHRQRPNAAAGFPMPSPRGPPPASRRDRRPARVTQLERNARIAQLGRGGRHRRGGRPGHRQRPNAAAGFPMPSPRGPPPASRRDRRPARNIQPGRNARIAQLDVGRRHRRGARPGHRRRSNTATGFPMPSPRGPPPAIRRDRRPARNASQGAMHALCGSTSAAATVAAPALATASARTQPPVVPRRHRAGRRPRAVTTAAPRGTSVQSAMHASRSSSTAAATIAAAGRVTAGARTLPPVFQSRRRAGRRPRTVGTAAPRGTPSQVRSSRCARSPMVAAAVAAPNPGTAPLPTAFSILPAHSHRRAVYRIRAPGQVSHITTGPRASSVFHNQHRCGKRRAADALAM